MLTTRTETLAEGVTLHMGDCRDVLPTLPRADVVITDPPYGIAAKWKGGWGKGHGWGNAHALSGLHNQWDAAAPDEAKRGYLRGLRRLAGVRHEFLQ